jgi:hypothetical protein
LDPPVASPVLLWWCILSHTFSASYCSPNVTSWKITSFKTNSNQLPHVYCSIKKNTYVRCKSFSILVTIK